MEFLLCTLTPQVQRWAFHWNHVIWRKKITKCWRNGNDSKQPYCVVCPYSIDGFWLFCWYFQAFGHCVVCPSSIYVSDYPFGIFKLLAIIYVLRCTASDYSFSNFKHLVIVLSVLPFIFLIIPLVTSNFSCILCSSTIIYIPSHPYRRPVSCTREASSSLYSIYLGNLREMFIYWIFILSVIEIKNVVFFTPLKISDGSKSIDGRNCHFIRFKLAYMHTTKLCGVCILCNKLSTKCFK